MTQDALEDLKRAWTPPCCRRPFFGGGGETADSRGRRPLARSGGDEVSDDYAAEAKRVLENQHQSYAVKYFSKILYAELISFVLASATFFKSGPK